jgi:8-oxo-dGTP diphosphatase
MEKSKIRVSHSILDPKGGIGVFVVNPINNKILIGRRKDNGLYAQPGGWLEHGEEWEECGSRELREETGLNIEPNRIKHIKTFNCFDSSKNYHNVAIYLYVEIHENELKDIRNCEPEKCELWQWVDFTFIQENLDKFFFPVKIFFLKEPRLKFTQDLKKLVKA